MKKVLKMTIGIKAGPEGKQPLPEWMEGEAPGVFATQVIEVTVDSESELGTGMFAKWMLDKEDDFIKDNVEIKWMEEAVDDDAPEA